MMRSRFARSARTLASHSRIRGYSLLETCFALGIMLIMGLGVIGGIIFTRQTMELDKQRNAALAYARKTMEEAQNTSSMLDAGSMTLIPFNAPGLEISAAVGVSYFEVNTNGTLSTTPIDSPPPRSLTLCRVTVLWNPAGSWSRQQQISVQGLITGTTTL